MSGAYKARIRLPQTAGYDGFGVIVEGGSGRLQSGTRVVPLAHSGTWQEYLATDEEECVHVPDELTDDCAAQLLINPVSVWLMIQRLNLAPGSVVIANAGGSAAGRLLAQLASVFNFRLFSIVRGSAHTQDLLRLGATAVIDSTEVVVSKVVNSLIPGGADAGLECVGGNDALELGRSLKRGATMIQYGLLSGNAPDFSSLADSGIHLQRFWLREWLRSATVMERGRKCAEVFQAISAHNLRLDVQEKFSLRHVHRAIQSAEASGRRGKVLLTSP